MQINIFNPKRSIDLNKFNNRKTHSMKWSFFIISHLINAQNAHADPLFFGARYENNTFYLFDKEQTGENAFLVGILGTLFNATALKDQEWVTKALDEMQDDESSSDEESSASDESSNKESNPDDKSSNTNTSSNSNSDTASAISDEDDEEEEEEDDDESTQTNSQTPTTPAATTETKPNPIIIEASHNLLLYTDALTTSNYSPLRIRTQEASISPLGASSPTRSQLNEPTDNNSPANARNDLSAASSPKRPTEKLDRNEFLNQIKDLLLDDLSKLKETFETDDNSEAKILMHDISISYAIILYQINEKAIKDGALNNESRIDILNQLANVYENITEEKPSSIISDKELFNYICLLFMPNDVRLNNKPISLQTIDNLAKNKITFLERKKELENIAIAQELKNLFIAYALVSENDKAEEDIYYYFKACCSAQAFKSSYAKPEEQLTNRNKFLIQEILKAKLEKNLIDMLNKSTAIIIKKIYKKTIARETLLAQEKINGKNKQDQTT